MAQEEWACFLKDRIPAYIGRGRSEEDRRRLREDDRGRGASRAATGRAPTLLNGLLACGRCGRPMAARSSRPGSNPRYARDAARREYGGPPCQGFAAAAADRLIEALALRAVEPAASELSPRAAERLERDREGLHRHWEQAPERAEYEATRARRQHDAAGPEDRPVARELERQREQGPAGKRRLEEEYARSRHERPRHLTAEDRERIRSLAADVPSPWRAATTTGADRRAVVRRLIERVSATRRGASEVVEVVVRWRGGAEGQHEVHQGPRRYDQLGDYAELAGRVKGLRAGGRAGGSPSSWTGRVTGRHATGRSPAIGSGGPSGGSALPTCRREWESHPTCPAAASGGCRAWRRSWA